MTEIPKRDDEHPALPLNGWWIEFLANVPGTPYSAPYRWGPYRSRASARIDAAYVTAEKITVREGATSEDDWKFAAFPPESPDCHAVSPRGERCNYKRGHDAFGEPHSWTLFGFGGPGR